MSNSDINFDAEAVLGEIKNQVRGHKLHEKGSERRLYSALKRTYQLGQYLLAKEHRLQEFVEDFNPKFWNKTAEKNPFQPLVKLAFEDIEKASLTVYATALKSCEEKGLNADDLAQQLTAVGVTAIYNNAKSNASAISMDKRYELDRQSHVEWGQKQLQARKPLTETKLGNGSPFDPNGELEFAVVKLVNGKLQIIDRVELPDKVRDTAVRQAAGKPPKRKHEKLADKNLYGLFKAADIFCRFLSKPKDQLTEYESQLLEEGKIPASYFAKSGLLLECNEGVWTANTVSELPTFKCVRVVIGNAMDKLDPSKTYFLGSAYCRILADEFPVEGDWKLSVTKGGVFVRKSKDKLKLPLTEFTQVNSGSSFQSLDGSRISEIKFDLPKNKLVFNSAWKQRYNLLGKSHIKFPRYLELAVEENELVLRFPHNRLIKHPLAQLGKAGSVVSDDRYVLNSDIVELANAAIDYDMDFTASIFTTYEQHCGIELHSDSDGTSIALPLAISISGDLGQITTY
ncbi:MAG: hypothetical protein ABJM29_10565 [Rhizobiaceae bacterium]